MDHKKRKYSVNLEFESIKLPPVTDVLVLGKKYPQGKIGVMESFRFIAPDEFEMFDINDDYPNVEAILVNKKILGRLPISEIRSILGEYVFPHVSRGEAVRVNFTVKIAFEGIKGTIEE